MLYTMYSMGQRNVYVSVAACFLLSGFAALLYQTAWMRQLSTVFGTSELAVATVLAAYMGGLALGAAIAGRYIDHIKRPVLTYGVLEGAVAVSALLVPALVEFAGWIYAALFGGQPTPPDASGFGQSLFYLGATFIILAIPTACMGATLPMLNRYAVRSDAQVGRRVGTLYAINTAGAIGGTLLAALLLLPTLGLNGTIYVGALINLIVFGLAALLSRSAMSPVGPAEPSKSLGRPQQKPQVAPRDEGGASEKPHPAGRTGRTGRTRISGIFERWATRMAGMHRRSNATGFLPWAAGLVNGPGIILPVMLVSGMASFTYEVLWTRLLAHILGGSVIAFATMLASFLSGIAIGSAAAAWLANHRRRSQIAFVICQLLIALTSLGIYFLLQVSVPDMAGLGQNIALAIGVLLPATVFIGATFPLAVRILSQNAQDAASASARVYAWNTLGAIAGSIIAGFVLIPLLRYEGAIKLAVLTNCALAFAVAINMPTRKLWFGLPCSALLIILMVVRPPIPEDLLRVSPLNDLRTGTLRYYDVGRSATVLMLERDGYFYLRTNGLPEASIDRRGAPPSKHTQRLLATIPIIARPALDNMLIVGLGGGVVAETIPPSVRDIDIIELEPKVVVANQGVAAERNENPLLDERITIIVNDARNALRLTDKRYDALVSQPSHPWTAGASHLYTREFMQLAKSRLTETGVFLQWMNLRFVSEELLKSLSATLLDVFPHVRAYHFEPMVVFFLASNTLIDPEAELIRSGIPLKGNEQVFRRKGIASVNDMIAALAWDRSGLQQLSQDADVTTDNDNQMAMRSLGGFESRALSYERVKALIAEFGPLYDPTSDIHRHHHAAINFVYVANRLAAIHAPELASRLRNLLEESKHHQSPVIAANFLLKERKFRQADRASLEALRRKPEDAIASYFVFRERSGSVLENTLPDRIQPYLKNLPADALAVLETLNASRRGDSKKARKQDRILAKADPDKPWYLNAAQLRVDWRLQAVRAGATPQLATEAMIIIDDAIALQQDMDFYGMRMVASFLAGDYNATVETARRMIRLIRDNLEFKRLNTVTSLTKGDFEAARKRLDAIAGGLKSVQEREVVDQYKIDDLEQQISTLQMLIERAESTWQKAATTMG